MNMAELVVALDFDDALEALNMATSCVVRLHGLKWDLNFLQSKARACCMP